MPKNPTVANNSPDSLPNLTKNPTTAENKEPKTDPTQNQTGVNSNPVKDAVEINKKPLKDFAANVKAKYDKKEVDLTQPFTVVAEGLIGSDGKLDTSIDPKTKQPKSRFIKWEGNEQMIEVAKQAFEAVGNSGWLAHLRGQGIEKINFTIVQDNDNLKVLITSEMPTPQRAETISSGVNNLISVPLTLDKNGFKKLGDDERTLLSNAKSSFNGKLFTLDFVLPKQTAQEMITRKLNEPVTEENKPQSTALASENNKAATK